MLCYDFIVKILKSGFRYISLKRDEVGIATNGLKTSVYKFSSVWESLVTFAWLSRKLWAKMSEKNDDFSLQTSLEFYEGWVQTRKPSQTLKNVITNNIRPFVTW